MWNIIIVVNHILPPRFLGYFITGDKTPNIKCLDACVFHYGIPDKTDYSDGTKA